jgi:hypothetical protein
VVPHPTCPCSGEPTPPIKSWCSNAHPCTSFNELVSMYKKCIETQPSASLHALAKAHQDAVGFEPTSFVEGKAESVLVLSCMPVVDVRKSVEEKRLVARKLSETDRVFDDRNGLLETHFFCVHGVQPRGKYHRVPEKIRKAVTEMDARLFHFLVRDSFFRFSEYSTCLFFVALAFRACLDGIFPVMVGFHFGRVNGQLRIKLDGSNNPFKINARRMNFVALKYTAHHEHGTSGANWKVGKVGQTVPIMPL